MNDSAAHKTAGGDAALWRARRDLLADAEARAKEMRRAVEQLRAALEAAGAALPPPADTDARLWPEAAAPPARGGRRSVDDHNAHKRMAALLEAGTARSVPEAARLVEAELKVEEDKLRPAGAKMPAREPGSVAKRLERGYRDQLDLFEAHFAAADWSAPLERQVVRYRAALAAAGLSFRDGGKPP